MASTLHMHRAISPEQRQPWTAVSALLGSSPWYSQALGGGTPYNGLYGEAPTERGTIFRLEVCERVGISRVQVWERVGKTAI